MLNYIWIFMIIIGIIYGSFTGQMAEISNGVIDSSKEAVQLCITMLGVVALWTGMMEIARDAGLVDALTRKLRPLLRFLFPRIPTDHPAMSYISLNFIANILGLGWAATPAGLKAMEALTDLEKERGNPEYADGKESVGTVTARKQKKAGVEARQTEQGGRTASNEMCVFLIMNISSLQLIPVNMIAYRSQYGSVNPAVIIAPAIIATLISTIAAIIYCKIKDRKHRC